MFEITSLYAFEFSRSQAEFDKFFKPYFAYVNENKLAIKNSLSLLGIAHLSIVLASFGVTTPEDYDLWKHI